MELRERREGKENNRASIISSNIGVNVEDIRMCIESC
jgi:hypothetical protein